MKVTLPAEEFAHALAATVAHATSGKDDNYTRTVDVQPINDELVCTASNGSTTGVARVPMLEYDGALGRFSIDRADVATVRGLFSSPNKDIELTLTESVHTPTDPDEKPEIVHQVQIRELGALFGGRQLKLTMPDHSKRDIDGIWHTIAAGLRKQTQAISRTTVQPKDLALFRAAAAAYGENLIIEPADGFGSLLIHCGNYFIGFMHADARTDERFAHSRDQWRQALPLNMKIAGTGT